MLILIFSLLRYYSVWDGNTVYCFGIVNPYQMRCDNNRAENKTNSHRFSNRSLYPFRWRVLGPSGGPQVNIPPWRSRDVHHEIDDKETP